MENAYKNAIMVGRFPSCVLNITVPSHLVDVNVHPAKTEVRFSDERKISSCLYYAVRSALQVDQERKQVDLSKLTQKPIPAAVQLQMVEDDVAKNEPIVSLPKANSVQRNKDFWTSMPSTEFRSSTILSSGKTDNPFSAKEETDLLSSYKKKSLDKKAQQPVSHPVNQTQEETVATETSSGKVKFTEEPASPAVRMIGEAFKTYIICEYNSKLCLIDKHAAHERMIFNRLKAQSGDRGRQILLAPVTLLVSKNEYTTIIDNIDAFSECGFAVEDFGGESVVVRECPMTVDPEDVHDLVLEITANLMQHKSDVQSEKIDRMMETTACKAAIKAGNKNDPAELLALAEAVLTRDDIRYCPHGRPVLIEMSRYELEKQFGRIQ